jgi:hypothetical protein
VNELEFMASLRDEVPLTASTRIEKAVLAEIEASREHALVGNRRYRASGPGHSPASLQTRRPALRPVLAGALAVAVGLGAYAGVELSRPGPSNPRQGAAETVAWAGRPTAPWPSTAHPSYGRATSEAQLIAYVTRAAATAPGRAPKPDEWVAVKIEHAGSSGGEGGYLFGPPDKRDVSLSWVRGDGCAAASVPPVPAATTPATTITGKLTIHTEGSGYYFVGCPGSGTTLGGWRSVTYSYLNSLPTNPAALEGVLAQSNGPVVAANRPQEIFQAIDELLSDGEMQGVVVPPKLSAAIYRVLQQLPGVHFESATDLAGRQGLGFYMVLEGYYKLELVIDPDTYTFMGFKDVATRDHAMTATDGTRNIKKGHVMGWAALLGQAIVDRPGQLPS